MRTTICLFACAQQGPFHFVTQSLFVFVSISRKLSYSIHGQTPRHMYVHTPSTWYQVLCRLSRVYTYLQYLYLVRVRYDTNRKAPTMSAAALGSLTRRLAHVCLSSPSMIACKGLAGSNVTQQLRFKTGGKGKRTIRVSLLDCGNFDCVRHNRYSMVTQKRS